jgi:hypothetical protein
VKFRFQAGDLARISRELSTHSEIEALVRREGINKDVAAAIGQMYVRWGLALEVALLMDSVALLTNPDRERIAADFNRELDEIIESDPELRAYIEEK